jgi:hypothetical protein
MEFTDNDLKWVKEEAEELLSYEFAQDELLALLARLEAAEEALATPHTNQPHTKDTECPGCMAVNKFLKAAGK